MDGLRNLWDDIGDPDTRLGKVPAWVYALGWSFLTLLAAATVIVLAGQ